MLHKKTYVIVHFCVAKCGWLNLSDKVRQHFLSFPVLMTGANKQDENRGEAKDSCLCFAIRSSKLRRRESKEVFLSEIMLLGNGGEWVCSIL